MSLIPCRSHHAVLRFHKRLSEKLHTHRTWIQPSTRGRGDLPASWREKAHILLSLPRPVLMRAIPGKFRHNILIILRTISLVTPFLQSLVNDLPYCRIVLNDHDLVHPNPSPQSCCQSLLYDPKPKCTSRSPERHLKDQLLGFLIFTHSIYGKMILVSRSLNVNLVLKQ